LTKKITPEHFIAITLNYQTLSLKDLHKYTLSRSDLDDFIKKTTAEPSIAELVGLSTCNRTEFYVAVHSVKDAAHAIVNPLAEITHSSLEELRPCLDVIVDAEGVEHLFRLVSSLESMIIGDAQIFGQVKNAFRHAQKMNTTHSVFNILFPKAFSAAKRVHTETGLGKGRVSVSALAVDCAIDHFSDLGSVVSTVIGAGKMGRLSARYLLDAGVQDLRIVNRNKDRSLALAQETGGTAVAFEELEQLLIDSQLIISGTASAEYLLTRPMMDYAVKQNPMDRLLIDIALPPDIDPAIASCESTRFIDLSDLHEKARKNQQQRQDEIKRAEAIIHEELERIGPWPLPFHIDRFASHLGELANQICEVEIDSLLCSLPELSPHQKEIIQTQMKRLAERMILAPRRNIRTHRAMRNCPNAVQCLADLFALEHGSRTKPSK
jgi:glutamyl-tRNA reductase